MRKDVCDEEVDVDGLWRVVEGTLRSVVVNKVERNGVDDIHKLLKQSSESDLEFVTRDHLLFQTQGGEERECAYVVFGKLGGRWQDKILDTYAVYSLSFSSLIELSKTKKDMRIIRAWLGYYLLIFWIMSNL